MTLHAHRYGAHQNLLEACIGLDPRFSANPGCVAKRILGLLYLCHLRIPAWQLQSPLTHMPRQTLAEQWMLSSPLAFSLTIDGGRVYACSPLVRPPNSCGIRACLVEVVDIHSSAVTPAAFACAHEQKRCLRFVPSDLRETALVQLLLRQTNQSECGFASASAACILPQYLCLTPAMSTYRGRRHPRQPHRPI